MFINNVHVKKFNIIKGCRIDTELYKKALSRNHTPQTLGTRLNRHKARWAGKGLYEHGAVQT